MATSDRFPLPQVGESSRKPEWLKVRLPTGEAYERVKSIIRRTGLATVCEEARCPNIAECWGGGTATVMLMGEVCTRACRFCHVKVGAPKPLDPQEPEHLAQAVRELALDYIVVTSVNRDDRPDGGASHFAQAIRALKRESPKTIVEVLIPDFQGMERDLTTVAEARPHVVAHNVETVERLTPTVRDRRAGYRQSLRVLEYLKKRPEGLYTKSSIMVGLGERDEEILQTCRDLRSVGVDVLTLGQYLQPSQYHLKVERFVRPEQFHALEQSAREMGFLYVAAGPLVRSSYRAAEFFLKGLMDRTRLDHACRT
ncbi:MAG TPA: lipoyl synthase [Myxococcaceae bacterium]|jgi:lipoic acid synthetase|nr:lipoyl synthase [Myxococcaceae bacterium]